VLREEKYFKTYTEEELWQRYCGFFDCSVDEFVDIQKHLLMQQVDSIANSTLGNIIMKGNKPKNVAEYRQVVPLTTYEDYEPYLTERQDNALAIKPETWCHSSGKSGHFRWVPYTTEALEVAVRFLLAAFILATASRKGEIRIKPGERVIQPLPPMPYFSATFRHYLCKDFTLRLLPSEEESEKLDFRERIQKGFQMALRIGVDEIGSLSSIMVKVGERMSEQAQGVKLFGILNNPKVTLTLGLAWLRSKRERRSLLPRDLWHLKGLITSGADTGIYKDSVEYYWGTTPYELYAATEGSILALQNWNKKWMTFIPYGVFLEFIPEDESEKLKEDDKYNPSTLLLDELEEGKVYEVVISQFYGMPLLRYRVGDVIKVVALSDEETGTKLPQIIFYSRVGETINLAGLASLTESVIWQAIANTEVPFEDWTACKEYDHDKTYLKIYIETKENADSERLAKLINEQLQVIDTDYHDIDCYLEFQPAKVVILSVGTFDRYYQNRVAEGADIAHLKPPHMNAPETVIQELLQLSMEV